MSIFCHLKANAGWENYFTTTVAILISPAKRKKGLFSKHSLLSNGFLTIAQLTILAHLMEDHDQLLDE